MQKVIFLSLLIFTMACIPPSGQVIQEQPLTLDTQVKALTDQIVMSLSQQEKSKIAVIEFSDLEGNVTKFGRYLSEELITHLFRTSKFEVIERHMLNKVMEEHSLTLSGMIDESSAKELGRILGIDAIASGTITDLGNHVKVNARLISTETGQVFSVASVKILKNEVVRNLMGSKIKAKPGVAPESAKSEPQPQKPATQVVEEAGFRIELQKCTLNNRKVICHLQVQNTSEDDQEFEVTYGWQYKTKIFDNLGNEYEISAVKYGDQLTKIKGLSQYDAARKKIIAGTSVPVELHFDNVSSQATRIALLQILCGYRGFKVEFRGIDLIK